MPNIIVNRFLVHNKQTFKFNFQGHMAGILYMID